MVTKRQIRKLKELLQPEVKDEVVLFLTNDDGLVENQATGETYTQKEWLEYKEKQRAEGDPVIELKWNP